LYVFRVSLKWINNESNYAVEINTKAHAFYIRLWLILRDLFCFNYKRYTQRRICCFGGPGSIKMWSTLPVTINLGYNSFLLFIIIIKNKKLTFRNFREADVSIKSVDTISVMRAPRGDRLGSSPWNPAQGILDPIEVQKLMLVMNEI
jgi:hypothetical protein